MPVIVGFVPTAVNAYILAASLSVSITHSDDKRFVKAALAPGGGWRVHGLRVTNTAGPYAVAPTSVFGNTVRLHEFAAMVFVRLFWM